MYAQQSFFFGKNIIAKKSQLTVLKDHSNTALGAALSYIPTEYMSQCEFYYSVSAPSKCMMNNELQWEVCKILFSSSFFVPIFQFRKGTRYCLMCVEKV